MLIVNKYKKKGETEEITQETAYISGKNFARKHQSLKVEQESRFKKKKNGSNDRLTVVQPDPVDKVNTI